MRKKTFMSCIPVIVVALMALIWGQIGVSAGGAMSYGIIFLYIAIPISTFLTCLFLSIIGSRLFWSAPFLLCAMPVLFVFITFGDLSSFVAVFSLIPALVGMTIGVLIRKLKKA